MRTQVDVRPVISLLGTIIKWLCLPISIPLTLSILNNNDSLPFIVPFVLSLAVGLLLEKICKNPDLGLKESFLLVSMSWLSVALIGCLPYIIAGNGTVAQPVNAFFESMSGFTTTGATVMKSISLQAHSPSIMLWRQLTQWLGGMGIIVLGIAILPKMSVGGSELIKAEAPGPEVEKLTPRIVETARRLWIVYLFLTLLLFVLLYVSYLMNLSPAMNFFNSVSHALTTMPTGGFSPAARSIEAFSPVVQWIIIPFMFLAGANFALQWRAITGRPDKLLKDAEFVTYCLIVAVFAGFLSLLLMGGSIFESTFTTLRHSLFQVLTIITTTGYASHDFNTWNQMSKTIIFLLMFCGGCAGSTGGGIKVMRWMVSIKSFFRELLVTAYPRVVKPIRIWNKIIDEKIIRRIGAMILLYLLTFVVGVLFVEFEGYRIGLSLRPIESMTTVAACVGNIGPGLGTVGPMSNYLSFSPFTKVFLAVLMWAGRLELFTLFVIFMPSYWKI